jgi:hypothetical protein
MARKQWDYEVEHTVKMADALEAIDYHHPGCKVVGHARRRPLIRFPNGNVFLMTTMGILKQVRD